MSDWYDDIEALRPREAEPLPKVKIRAPRNWAIVGAACVGAALIAVASSGGAFNRGSDSGSAAPPPSTTRATVKGVTVTRPPSSTTSSTSTTTSTAPAVTVTTVDAFAAALEAATPPSTAPPTSSSTTTSTAPAAIPRASASSAAPGVTLLLDATPAGRSRSVNLRLDARFDGLRVLRRAHVDFGDGTAVNGDVREWACGEAGAPNPYVLSVPTHTYRAPGTYTVTVTAVTAACSAEDDDFGPDEPAEVRLILAVP